MKWVIELFGGTATPDQWTRPPTIDMKLRIGQDVSVRNNWSTRERAELVAFRFLSLYDNIGVRIVPVE